MNNNYLCRVVSTIVLFFVMSSCASSAKNVSATYVSPLQYQHYSCDQLRQEYTRVSQRMYEVSEQQDSAAARDAVGMAVGMLVFWPALFVLAASDKKHELARLKGECEAIESCAIEKNCALAAEIKEAKKHYAERNIEEEQDKQEDTHNWGTPSGDL